MNRRVIVDELEFEVPYGKLAAKTWGEDTDDCKRVLALHGWMDNAGSFDHLMPRLKHDQGLYIVALDLPGHGKSSQLPPGSSYSDLGIVMEVRRCVTELEWNQPIKKDINGENKMSFLNSSSQEDLSEVLDDEEEPPSGKKKFTIVGHSLGAGLALLYSSLYPNDVEEVVSLDFIKSRTTSPRELMRDTAATIDSFINVVPSQSPFSSPLLSKANANSTIIKTADKGQVVVSQEAAIIATIEAHKNLGDITREDATCLLKRCTVAVSTPPNSVIFSRDLRLQAMLNLREHIEVNKIMFAAFKCRVLIILSKRGLYSEDRLFKDKMKEMEQYFRERAKTLHIEWVDADHYLHMNRYCETSAIINKYLEFPENFVPTSTYTI